jgi:thiol-disulfide isomerase/thioredoxin
MKSMPLFKLVVFLFIWTCSYSFLYASQPYAMIFGKVHSHTTHGDMTEQVSLVQYYNGNQNIVASITCDENGFFGIVIYPGSEGDFYYFQRGRNSHRIYLKPGDNIEVSFSGRSYDISGSLSEENKAIALWNEKMAPLVFKLYDSSGSIYEDYFPELNTILDELPSIERNLQTSNQYFNRRMKRFVELDIDNNALNYLFSARLKHPQSEELPAYYNSITNEKLKFADLLDYPGGQRLMDCYFMKLPSINNTDNLDKLWENVPNDTIKHHFYLRALDRIENITRNQLLEYTKKYGTQMATADQQQRMDRIIESANVLRDGYKAPDFSFPDAKGKMYSLADFSGKIVLIDVWATWCAPCLREMPLLMQLKQELQDEEDFVVIGISVDRESDKNKWQAFIKERELSGIQLYAGDSQNSMRDLYNVRGIPHFILIGRDGTIIRYQAPYPSTGDLKEIILKHL